MLISGGGSFWVLENEAYCWVHATARMSQKLHPATIQGHWVRQQEKPYNRSRSQCVVKSQTAINTPRSSTCNVYVTLLKLFAKTIKQNNLFQLIKVLCWLKVLEIEPNCCGNEGKVRIDTLPFAPIKRPKRLCRAQRELIDWKWHQVSHAPLFR